MIRIFIEGTTDIKFLIDFVYHKFGYQLSYDCFIKTNGWGNLFNEINLNQIRLVNDQGGNALVLFDADDDFSKRQQTILNKSDLNGVKFNLFLFPNNHDAGDRELLLERIANPKVYDPFFACYKPYQDCLQNYNLQHFLEKGFELKIPPTSKERKLRIINYLNLYGQKSDEDKRNYTDIDYWNLNHEALNSLVDFLSPFFHE